ncbi:hypothetical protein CMV30_04765 [Nibricoccus aquaticus]|uniref:Uncharacterized protein n=1 Tax=Nibricoccus aquaticus TaxID=2576891 RepID=A0A290Q823_9BACT|nr:hypothetical protein [Nibricoccus aquaticus]ATC63320.1 hypothetical protein CMV30_04765 [Nibricoccus aquaticus]
MNYPSWTRRVLSVACLLSSAWSGRAEDKPVTAPAAEPVVDMPQYVVQETRVLPMVKSWRYVRVPALVMERGKQTVVVPGYEVLSNVSEKNTRLFVSEIQLRQFAGAYMWPMLVNLQPRQPLVVIFDETKQASLTPDSSEAIAWSGDPIAASDAGSADFASGAFDSGAWLVEAQGVSEREAINSMPIPGEIVEEASSRVDPRPVEKSTFDIGSRRLPLPPGYVVLTAREGLIAAQVNADQPLASAEKPTEEQLAANLSAWISVASLQNLPGGAPRWFDAGLHRLIELTDVTPTRLAFAQGIVMPAQKRLASLQVVLAKTGALTEEEKLVATAFVHHGLYGDNGKHAEQFMKFTERVTKGTLSDALFKECFGKTMKQVDQELATYGRSFSAFRSIETRGQMPSMPEFTVREATQSEAARLLADALITQGKPDRALDELRIAYWRGEREPEMLAVLAALEERLGSVERARKLSGALMALPKPPVRVLPVEAKLVYREAVAARADGAKLTVAETRKILSLMARAIREGQNSEEVWAFFSEVVLRSEGKPHESIGAFLAQAAKRYPGNTTIRQAVEFARVKS